MLQVTSDVPPMATSRTVSLRNCQLLEAAELSQTPAEVVKRLTRSKEPSLRQGWVEVEASLASLLLAALAARSSELLEIAIFLPWTFFLAMLSPTLAVLLDSIFFFSAAFLGAGFLGAIFLGAGFLVASFLGAVFFCGDIFMGEIFLDIVFLLEVAFFGDVFLEPAFFRGVFFKTVFLAAIFLGEAVFLEKGFFC